MHKIHSYITIKKLGIFDSKFLSEFYIVKFYSYASDGFKGLFATDSSFETSSGFVSR